MNKKSILTAVLLILCLGNAVAQKYMTRTAKVAFHAGTSLEDIDGISNEAASVIDSKKGDFIFQVAIKSFKFRRALMEEHFNENYMESDKMPRADYKGTINDISTVNFDKDGSYKVNSAGKLTIHGVTKDVTIPATITIKGGKVETNAKFIVKPADYNVQIPKLVENKIAKEVEVSVNSILDKK
jgi:hypothetical protein